MTRSAQNSNHVTLAQFGLLVLIALGIFLPLFLADTIFSNPIKMLFFWPLVASSFLMAVAHFKFRIKRWKAHLLSLPFLCLLAATIYVFYLDPDPMVWKNIVDAFKILFGLPLYEKGSPTV